MKQFTDANGKKWSLAINIGTVKLCRDLLGVNLLEPEAGNPPLVTSLGTDDIFLVDLIYCLCKEEADKAGITDIAFGQSFNGKVLHEAANAFFSEYMDFFRDRGRTDRLEAISREKQIIDKATQRAKEEIEKLDLDDAVEQVFGNGSIGLPESPESTPTP